MSVLSGAIRFEVIFYPINRGSRRPELACNFRYMCVFVIKFFYIYNNKS